MGLSKAKVKSFKLPKGAELYRQTYDKAEMPEGVVIVKQAVHPDDQGGWLKESFRLDDNGEILALKELGIKLKVRQSTQSVIAPGVKRFWHIHPKQCELWNTNNTLLVGLVDLRDGSKTYGVKSKVVLSSDKALYIPAGIAHGLINPNNFPVTLTYFLDTYFDVEDTQEYRVDPKMLPFDFVEPEVL